jgi:hypothetical protein
MAPGLVAALAVQTVLISSVHLLTVEVLPPYAVPTLPNYTT